MLHPTSSWAYLARTRTSGSKLGSRVDHKKKAVLGHTYLYCALTHKSRALAVRSVLSFWYAQNFDSINGRRVGVTYKGYPI